MPSERPLGMADGDPEPLLSASATIRHETGAAQVVLVGDVCAPTAEVLATMLDRLVADGVRSVTVDLSSARSCTTDGEEVLERFRARLATEGGSLTLLDAAGAAGDVLPVTDVPLASEAAPQ